MGNGPSVMEGQPHGDEIDKFAQVVRFNSYNMKKPAYTGSKINFHFCNGRSFPTSKDVSFVVPLFNASLTHAAYLFMPHLEDSQDIYEQVTNDEVNAWVVDEDSIQALRKEVNCRPWQIPTSGAVAIDAFTRSRSTVWLHGFDFFEGAKIHYFEESPTQLITSWLERFVTHDPSREKKWVERLCMEDKATFLSQRALTSDVPEKEKHSEARKRPSLIQTILEDGVPSQFPF